MRQLIAAAIIALPLVLAPVATAPTAQDSCNDTKWTWPLCHIRPPSIPHYNMGGPRPPLTPKNSVWCREAYIYEGNNIGWYLIDVRKHNIRFWPDYESRTYVSIVWNGRMWAQPDYPTYTSTDCDT